MSGQPTQANSVNDEVQKWSYFEKMERLKKKIIQAHNQAKLDSTPDTKKCLKEDKIHWTDNIQVPHPDWQKEKEEHQKNITDTEKFTGKSVISFKEYMSSRK